MCNNDGGRGNFVFYYDLLAILMISHTLVKQVWSNLDKDVKKIRKLFTTKNCFQKRQIIKSTW